MPETIKQILIRRDFVTEEDADRMIKEAKTQFNVYIENGETDHAYNICDEFFGLEPDYLDDLIFA